ncbi:MAG TPA: DUF6232 family protein [Thermoanaerobaculia bacterium]|nr:DUF6232 family protein [Thermoanaerobaculia bacterium]
MADERIFFNEGNVYVSNTKIMLNGTTYAAANITSVTKRLTPPDQGVAVILIVIGALAIVGAMAMFNSEHAEQSIGIMIVGAAFFLAGILAYRAAKPILHMILTSAAGEKERLSSRDTALVDKVTAAISDSITYRG